MDDDELEPADDSEGDKHEAPAPNVTNDAIGPVAAVVVGFLTFYLAKGLSLLPRLGVAFVVMAVVVFITVEIARRRRHRDR